MGIVTFLSVSFLRSMKTEAMISSKPRPELFFSFPCLFPFAFRSVRSTSRSALLVPKTSFESMTGVISMSSLSPSMRVSHRDTPTGAVCHPQTFPGGSTRTWCTPLDLPRQTRLREFVAQAKSNGISPILAIGGWGSSQHISIAVEPENSTSFVHAVLGLVTNYGLDGIDSRWNAFERST
ncbi:hypothetical protein B0H10DRAFT_773676 [Mycena sp. CBHHK59/15]|nr:hypothetical protein B0H10DRAFT_773676 [Mycena sp. CBHHK59/15]